MMSNTNGAGNRPTFIERCEADAHRLSPYKASKAQRSGVLIVAYYPELHDAPLARILEFADRRNCSVVAHGETQYSKGRDGWTAVAPSGPGKFMMPAGLCDPSYQFPATGETEADRERTLGHSRAR